MKYFFGQSNFIKKLSNVLFRAKKFEPAFQSIVIFDFHMIGDMVILIPLLRNLKRAFPEAHIVIVAPSWAAPVHQNLDLYNQHIEFIAPWVRRQTIWQATRNTLKLIYKLRKLKFDTGIEVRGDLRQIFLMRLCAVRSIIGYSFTGGKNLLSLEVPDDGQYKSLIEHHLQIVRAARITPDHFLPELKLSEAELQVQREIRRSRIGKTIGLQPFASNTLKEWPREKVLDLIALLSRKYSCIVYYAPAEKEKARAFMTSAPTKCLPLRQFIVELSTLDYFIGMDSGPAHLAAALGVPVAVLFGPVVPEFSLPAGRAPIHGISLPDIPCRPCDQKKCIHLNFQHCMSYSPPTVFKQLNL